MVLLLVGGGGRLQANTRASHWEQMISPLTQPYYPRLPLADQPKHSLPWYAGSVKYTLDNVRVDEHTPSQPNWGREDQRADGGGETDNNPPEYHIMARAKDRSRSRRLIDCGNPRSLGRPRTCDQIRMCSWHWVPTRGQSIQSGCCRSNRDLPPHPQPRATPRLIHGSVGACGWLQTGVKGTGSDQC